MPIRTFQELDPRQRVKLLAFVGPFRGPDTLEALDREYGGPAFSLGHTHWSFWRGEKPTATLGAVTMAHETKGEIYLTQAFPAAQAFDDLGMLLDRGLDELKALLPCRLKFSASHLVPGLGPWVQARGFSEAYRLLEMEHGDAAPGTPSRLEWQPVTRSNADAFREVHHLAFLASPNAIGLDGPGMERLLDQYQGRPGRLQLGLLEGAPAVAVETDLDDQLEGWVSSLGVHPRLQGHGLGREGLRHALWLLREEGARRIRLTVIDANQPALSLYFNEGFRTVRTLSTVLSQDR